MSYNGSGTFQINTSGQPVVAGTVISATAFNALTADLATGLSTAITKDGQTTTTARIPFAAGISSTLTTDSSSVSTGSIITAGGVGVAKNLYVGVNANVAGTLGVTGVATFSAAPIYSSLTASSAVATDASKGLVSVTNTGTGNNVLATSPTLVTPILGAASATSVTVAAGAVGTPSITTTGDTNTGIFFPAADTIAFSEGGAEAMRLDSAGNMGLGVTPSAWGSTRKAFQVGTGASLIGSSTGTSFSEQGANVYLNSGSSEIYIGTDFASKYRQANSVHSWYVAPSGTAGNAISFTQAMTLDASGNLGIGTSSPANKLDVQGVVSALYSFESTGAVQANSANKIAMSLESASVGRIAVFGTDSSTFGTTVFSRAKSNGGTTESMRIDSSGNLLVGTTTPYRTGQSAISSTSVYGLRIQPTSATNGIALEINAPNVTSGTSSFLIAASAAGADKMYCYSNGNIVNVNNSYGTLSDVKLKENIVDASPKLADVMQLKVRNFNLKTEPDHKQIGFIAQELEQIFPALIDNTTSPNDPDDVIKSIKTSVLVPILVKAIQEQQALITTLTDRITALEAK